MLGKSPSWQDRGGACSGYLIEADGLRLLLDCGSGVLGKLRDVCEYGTVDVVLISHLHADHILDLVPFTSALSYSTLPHARRPALWLPPGGQEFLTRLMTDLTGSDEGFRRAFELHEYDPQAPLELGALTVRFCEVPHYTTAFAVDLADRLGRRFTFGADCGPNSALAAFANGTGLLALEATLGGVSAPAEPGRGHMTAREAGELGRAANAVRLVITHFSDELDRDAVQRDASGGYGGEVQLAADGLVVTV